VPPEYNPTRRPETYPISFMLLLNSKYPGNTITSMEPSPRMSESIVLGAILNHDLASREKSIIGMERGIAIVVITSWNSSEFSGKIPIFPIINPTA
jgi:hypothetical protein